ncbi:MAG: hypothetical protein HY437_01195 [Candidatus Magasanikbacteria bacterium]|nr:hypothetical protein [Candidatus Magasanikbacteria bacterium]
MPSVGAQLDNARNRAALSPSFREGGVSIMANPTDMPQYGGAETEEEMGEETMSGGYGYGAFAGDEAEDDGDGQFEDEDDTEEDEDDGAAEQQRGILQAQSAQALASSATKKLDPMDNLKFVTLDWWIWILFTPSGWVSYLKVDSYINPTETSLRLIILKVTFWTVLILGIAFLTVVIVIATAEINPFFRILKFWAGVFS